MSVINCRDDRGNFEIKIETGAQLSLKSGCHLRMEGVLHLAPFKKNPYYVNMRWLNDSALNEAGERSIMENPKQKIEEEMLTEIGNDIGFAAIKEREIWERLDKKDNFFSKIEGFLTSIFSSLAISMISAVLVVVIYKTACICLLIKKCKGSKDDEMEIELFERREEKMQRLAERIAALEGEEASLMTQEEDEKKYQENRREEQQHFNKLISENINDLLFITSGLIRTVGVKDKVRNIIRRRIDANLSEKLEGMMEGWKKEDQQVDSR